MTRHDDGDDRPYLPVALTVMAGHSTVPVWRRPYGDGEPVEAQDLAALGVPEPLLSRLQAWSDVLTRVAVEVEQWDGPEAEQAWEREGLHLAHELQDVVPEVEVHHWQDGRSRPVRGRRG